MSNQGSQQSANTTDSVPRKGDHLRLSQDPRSQADGSVFEKYRLPYNALPELFRDEVDTSYELFGKRLSMPLIIASMTGGTEHGRTINTNLALAAEACGVALGVGSQRIGLERPEAKETFELIREHAPTAVVIANMGAVQLNYGHHIDSYRRVVDMIQADALYLHLNPLQEALQPGGDTDFRGLTEKIRELVSKVVVPVLVKEVGHGISRDVARRLFDVGVYGVDVAGVGGTSYAWIEGQRADQPGRAKLFKSFGIPTDVAVIGANKVRQRDDQLVIASGGVRSSLDGLKSRALGADLFSAAQPFLEPSIQSAGALTSTIDTWRQDLQDALFAVGLPDWKAAAQMPLYDAQTYQSIAR